ncbi:MAG TPA: hypothetical protein DD490_01450 [Acidobacteria bacterium]|nr:hypothetical protein [Acidobacteriota bacterium]
MTRSTKLRGTWVAALLLSAAFSHPVAAQTPAIQGTFVEPPRPTTADEVTLVVYGRQSPDCRFTLGSPSFFPDILHFQLQASRAACDSPATEPFETRVPLGRLAAGDYQVGFQVGSQPLFWYEMFAVHPTSRSARLHDELFHVDVEWRNPANGNLVHATALPLTDESAAFWFFGPDNVEVTVKVLDGRPVNGHWWVFLASMTDLELTVTVLENLDDCLRLPSVPPSCPTRTYRQTAGANRNLIDVQAFAE